MAAFTPDKSLRKYIPVREHRESGGDPVYRFNKQGIPTEVFHVVAEMLTAWQSSIPRTDDTVTDDLIDDAITETITFLNSL